MTVVEMEKAGRSASVPRLCHILDFETGRSLCLVKPLTGNEGDIHDKEMCKRDHQMCVVCLTMYEQRWGSW